MNVKIFLQEQLIGELEVREETNMPYHKLIPLEQINDDMLFTLYDSDKAVTIIFPDDSSRKYTYLDDCFKPCD